ncbi:MAG: aspartate aminotransferase family protein [Chloroflexi bacterium]|nr:MAG: aspartate aminotransferase family protein [Chloroflexota bacterium]
MSDGKIFSRGGPLLPRAVRGEGAYIIDASGRRYLDAAGGAIVVGVGHGRADVAAAAAEQMGRIAYAHGSAFTTDALESWASEVGPLLPIRDASLYPVSGGSEAAETALKMVRAYWLAKGETERTVVVSRWGSYHGNTLGALDLSGRKGLRRPYEPWLGRFEHVSAPYPYRAGLDGANAIGSGAAAVAELDALLARVGPGRIAAFVAEPIVGATLAAAVPPDDYWPAVAAWCAQHNVLLVADEVMTGFGRTGTWFGVDHWQVKPDLLLAAKGATSGYWPFGFVAAAPHVAEPILASGFVHGFTYSHSLPGAAVARAVLKILRAEQLVDASAARGAQLHAALVEELAGDPWVGEIRGRGLLLGIELVADRATKAPHPRAARVTERIIASAKQAGAEGLLLYSGTAQANGVDGDQLVIGPPLVIGDAEIEQITAGTAAAIRAVRKELAAS